MDRGKSGMANASMGYVFVICSIILRCSAHHILTARSLGDTPQMCYQE
jgi:hypothetical protein